MATWEGTITTTDAGPGIWYVATESMPTSAFINQHPNLSYSYLEKLFDVKKYEGEFKGLPELEVEKDHLAELEELFDI